MNEIINDAFNEYRKIVLEDKNILDELLETEDKLIREKTKLMFVGNFPKTTKYNKHGNKHTFKRNTNLRLTCKYGEKCYQKNPEHMKIYFHPNNEMEILESAILENRAKIDSYIIKQKIAAKQYTDVLFDKFYQEYLDNDNQLSDNCIIYINTLNRSNYNSNYGLQNYPYTNDMPNFAILISIVGNLQEYKNKEEFIKLFLFTCEQEGITGTYNYTYGLNNYISFKNQYPDLWNILNDNGIYINELENFKPISNTLVIKLLDVKFSKKRKRGGKHKTKKHKTKKHKTKKHKTRKHKTRKHKTRKHKTRNHKTRKHKIKKHKTRNI